MILAAFLVALTIGMLAFFLIRLLGPEGAMVKEKQLRQRLSPNQSYSTAPTQPLAIGNLLKKNNLSNFDFAKSFLGKRNLSKTVLIQLQTAGLKISVSTYFLICLGIGGASFFAMRLYMPVEVAAPIAIGLCFVPFMILRYIRNQYLDKFTSQLPNAISIVSGAIKVGHGLEAAIGTIAKTAPQPIAGEFATVQAEMKLGLTMTNALNNLYDRIQTPELKILVTGVTINQQLGGNLTELLGNLEKTIRERFQLIREIRSLSSQGIMSATVIFFIPFAILALLFKNDAKLMMEFFQTFAGRMCALISILCQIIAFFWIRSIIRLKD